MRLFFLLLIAFSITSSLFASEPSPEELKSLKANLVRALDDSKLTDQLYSSLQNRKSDNPLLLACIGTLEALKAKHAWNPYNKFKFAGLSQQTLTKAVLKAPDNLEIRFMRFSIQHFLPSFLGFSKNLDEDKKMILKQLHQKKGL